MTIKKKENEENKQGYSVIVKDSARKKKEFEDKQGHETSLYIWQ